MFYNTIMYVLALVLLVVVDINIYIVARCIISSPCIISYVYHDVFAMLLLAAVCC